MEINKVFISWGMRHIELKMTELTVFADRAICLLEVGLRQQH